MSELQLYSGTQPRPAAAANAKRFGRPVLAAVKSSRRPGSRCLRLSEAYKAGFLQRELSRNPDSTHQRFLHGAVEEAASLAWMSGFPALVLPTLLEEKALEAASRADRQRDIFQRSSVIAALAE